MSTSHSNIDRTQPSCSNVGVPVQAVSTPTSPNGMPSTHKCSPSCPSFLCVRSWFVQRIEDTFKQRGHRFSLEQCAIETLRGAQSLKAAVDQGRLPLDIYNHLMIFCHVYGKRFTSTQQQSGPSSVSTTAQAGGSNPVSPPTKVTSREGVPSSPIHEILFFLGLPCDASTTNEEAARSLLQNFDQIRSLAIQGQMNRQQLSQIRQFATVNLDALNCSTKSRK